MQYIKIKGIKIPYKVIEKDHFKYFRIFCFKIPFSTYIKQNRKCYKIAGIPVPGELLKRLTVSRGKSHYLMRKELDEERIKRLSAQLFEEKLGYKPDFEHPRTMNEKIFWMKLYYHDPLITKCCDKYTVKEYISERLGDSYVVPTIQAWYSAEEIDFSILPKQFALKVNWSSGYNVIVWDKSEINEEVIKKQVSQWMRPESNSYFQGFNWGYKDIVPVVYAEKYIEQVDGQLFDYKFFCCNGKAQFLFIATDRYNEEASLTYDFFDMDFNRWNFEYGNKPHAKYTLSKPKFFDEMVRCAEILSTPFPFVRVDFYETDQRFYIGEMTFYSGGGILPFNPEKWDYKLGQMIPIPIKEK